MQNAKVLKSLIVSAALVASSFISLSHSMAAMGKGASPVMAAAAGANAAEIFGAKCAICHGKDGRGQQNWRAKGQPDFTDANWQKSRTDAQIADSIKNGKGKFMPAWKNKLSEEEIIALAGRVRAFGKK